MISIIENEGMVLAAKNAIKTGCTNELISSITGLMDEQIDQLRKQFPKQNNFRLKSHLEIRHFRFD